MKKIIFTTLFLLLLAGFGFTYAAKYFQHPLPNGRLLAALAFEHGDAVTVSYTVVADVEQLQIGYYDVNGAGIAPVVLTLAETPQTLILQACGAYLQIFVGYRPAIPADPSTAKAERFIWQMPVVQACAASQYLPLVLGLE